MCTAVGLRTKDFYFGRTLDLEFSYGEMVTLTPRKYSFNFRNGSSVNNHFAIIGMAHVVNNYPLYFDAVNEKGLSMAALNFVGNAYFYDEIKNMDNIAQFEFIPWILGQCSSVHQAREKIENTNITNIPFSEELPVSQLHWIIADKDEAITVECIREGIKVHDNPVGVLTNNPPFEQQMFMLNNYINLSPRSPQNNFSSKLQLNEYSRGMGALGLPGDLTSQSRFVRACFTKLNSVCGKGEEESVNQFFHIMGTVSQTRGCCDLGKGHFEVTIYTSCCNADKGIYYYTTYNNHQISAVDMHKEDLNGSALIKYPLFDSEQIRFQN